MEDYEKTFDEFWADLVLRSDGTLDVDQVKRELHDYRTLLHEVPLVYCHVTGNRISKPNTNASAVTSEADEYYERQTILGLIDYLMDEINDGGSKTNDQVAIEAFLWRHLGEDQLSETLLAARSACLG